MISSTTTTDSGGATLTVASIPDYIGTRPALASFAGLENLDVTEVGDGNLNQVFLCRAPDGRTLVLKQALPYVRLVGPSWPMTEERATREAEAITAHAALSDNVCRVIDFDHGRHVLALQDLTDHTVLRTHLNAGADHVGIAEILGRHIADTAFGTSFLAVGEEPFRLAAAAAVNSELCVLTEDVIFTEPFLGAERNSVRSPEVRRTVEALQADEAWVAAAMAMKLRFVTVQESLLHGDLHTGSVFVRRDAAGLSVKTFDPEFAFYGPIGFDLGLLWANLLIAGVRAHVLGETVRGDSLLMAVAASWTTFECQFRERWADRSRPDKYTDALVEQWLPAIRADAFGFAGCEATRRIVGIAKVTDIETLPPEKYTVAADAVLAVTRVLLVQRTRLTFDDLVGAARAALP